MDSLLALSLLNSFFTILAGYVLLEWTPRSRALMLASGWLLTSGVLMLGATLFMIREVQS